MTGNAFGQIFRYTSFGESHGKAIGCVVEGVPAQISLTEADIQPALDKRRPGQSKLTSTRKESDIVEILSGTFNGQTTGTPIGLLIKNIDQHSADYSDVADKYRPSHADLTYQLKYGIRDYRGGGRSSARETAVRVAAGAIAEQILKHFIKAPFSVEAKVIQVGLEKNPDLFNQVIENARLNQNSVGGIVEIKANGIPAGLGEPVYDRLDADLAKALMSINAVKGVEIGDGFQSATLYGDQNADEMYADPTQPNGIGFSSNHAGGILGGISSGQEIIARIAVKPTPSISVPLKTVCANLNETIIETHGRHDPCVALRAVSVARAMTLCVLADHYLRWRATCP